MKRGMKQDDKIYSGKCTTLQSFVLHSYIVKNVFNQNVLMG